MAVGVDGSVCGVCVRLGCRNTREFVAIAVEGMRWGPIKVITKCKQYRLGWRWQQLSLASRDGRITLEIGLR